jgi:peptidoglycan/xylan/chitin deacetylase (PgdA/CDA1 family)
MNNSDGIELPIIMYHSILKDTELSGKYVVTPTTLENDLSFIEENGYTTVSMGDVINYVENGAELPDKPIMLTFDDGCYNNYGYALPIIEAHNAHAVFCIVGEYAEQYSKSNIANLTYGYMRWCDIRELAKSPSAEIANHSYAFHSNTNGRNGAKKNPSEDLNSYIKIFKSDTETAQELFKENVGFEPIIYTYPFGAYSEEAFDLLKNMGFKATFSCNEGINIITRGGDLSLLKRYNRPSGISSEEFFKNIMK